MHKNHNLVKVLQDVMPSVVAFARKHRYQDNVVSMAKGELFTQLRRHMNSLIVQTNFKKENIGTFMMDREGVIQYIEFNKYYSGSKHRVDFIEALNDAMTECDFDFHGMVHTSQIEKLLEEEEDYNIKL